MLESVQTKPMALKSPPAVFSPTADLVLLNKQFKGVKPSEVMSFTVMNARNPVVFTNFRPLAIAFLHLVTRPLPDIPVIWSITVLIHLRRTDILSVWWID